MRTNPQWVGRVAAGVLASSLFWASSASAQASPDESYSSWKYGPTQTEKPASFDDFSGGEDQHRLTWKYPRFAAWQVGVSVAQTAASVGLEFGLETADSGWRNGILIDDTARSGLVAHSPEGRARAGQVSDMMWYSTQGFAVLDSLVTPLAADAGNTDVALQLTLINWQAFGFSFLATRIPVKAVGRGRPSLKECDADPGYDKACDPNDPGRTQSAFSGHTSMTFTAASLICMHHAYLELYGEPALDYGVCGLAMASATTVGTLRIVADKHWTSDVLIGAGIGLVSGLGVPYLFHYSHTLEAKPASSVEVAFAPVLSEDTLGVGAKGYF
ncbi:MAG: phosphatase PAP2 family protein [Myxococcales bacterium]|nr:phosphatase PAP2 family protein [Myxococcales bacterium]